MKDETIKLGEPRRPRYFVVSTERDAYGFLYYGATELADQKEYERLRNDATYVTKLTGLEYLFVAMDGIAPATGTYGTDKQWNTLMDAVQADIDKAPPVPPKPLTIADVEAQYKLLNLQKKQPPTEATVWICDNNFANIQLPDGTIPYAVHTTFRGWKRMLQAYAERRNLKLIW